MYVYMSVHMEHVDISSIGYISNVLYSKPPNKFLCVTQYRTSW